MKRDYENDAWEMLEDYFDRIRDELINANIKGDERRQVITDLRSHVQMKADEILSRHDSVNYADVLEIMGELGSPSEIAGSYGSMDDVKAKSVDELFTEKKNSSLDLPSPSITVKTQVTPPTTLPEASPYTPQKNNIIVELCLLSLRIFQVIIFIQPWIQLAMFSYRFTENGIDPWGIYSFSYYENILLVFYVPYIFTVFVLVMLEQYIVREFLITRSNNPGLQSNLSIHLFRFALLSNLIIFFIVPGSGFVIIYASIGTAILLLNEVLTESPLRTFIFRRIKESYDEIKSNDEKNGILMLIELFIFQVGVYIAVIIYMMIALYMITNIKPSDQWIMVLVLIFAGLLFAVIALNIKLYLNRLLKFSISRVEMSSSIWAFRFILASLFAALLWSMNPLGVIVLVALPLLFIEQFFSKIVAATTNLDFVFWQEITGSYMSIIQLLAIFGSIETRRKKISYFNDQESLSDPETTDQAVIVDKPEKKQCEFMIFFKKILVIYVKVSLAFLFFLTSVSLENVSHYWDWDDAYSYNTAAFGTIIMIAFMLISTYVLYTESTSGAEKLDRPWSYFLIMVFSWILLFQVSILVGISDGFTLLLIWFLSSPFLLIQITSSYILLFKANRRDY